MTEESIARWLEHPNYCGTPLNLEPLNEPWPDLAREIAAGRACYVHLQPGDATRYEFWLLPQWGDFLRPDGLSRTAALRLLQVAQLNGAQRCFTVAIDYGPESAYFSAREYINNEHTCRVLAGFLDRLVKEMQK